MFPLVKGMDLGLKLWPQPVWLKREELNSSLLNFYWYLYKYPIVYAPTSHGYKTMTNSYIVLT